jgi:hypothetical protein
MIAMFLILPIGASPPLAPSMSRTSACSNLVVKENFLGNSREELDFGEFLAKIRKDEESILLVRSNIDLKKKKKFDFRAIFGNTILTVSGPVLLIYSIICKTIFSCKFHF